MKKSMRKWTNADFDQMNWHDNTLHGIGFRVPRQGYDCDLVLDIDFILEVTAGPDGKWYEFLLVPATLAFHLVSKCHIDLGMAYREQLQIDRIDREDCTTGAERKAGLVNYRWTIFLQSLSGHENRITFESAGFTQLAKGKPKRKALLWLEEEER